MTSFGLGCLWLQLLVTVVSALTSSLFRKVDIFDLHNQRTVVATDKHSSSKLTCLAVLASRQQQLSNNMSVDTMGVSTDILLLSCC